jgi:hypothetical protein
MDLIPRGVASSRAQEWEPVGWLADAMARAAKVDYFRGQRARWDRPARGG